MKALLCIRTFYKNINKNNKNIVLEDEIMMRRCGGDMNDLNTIDFDLARTDKRICCRVECKTSEIQSCCL